MIKRRVSEKKRTNAVSIDSPNSASLRLNLFQFFLPLSYGSLGLWSKPFASNQKRSFWMVLMVTLVRGNKPRVEMVFNSFNGLIETCIVWPRMPGEYLLPRDTYFLYVGLVCGWLRGEEREDLGFEDLARHDTVMEATGFVEGIAMVHHKITGLQFTIYLFPILLFIL